ncbi:TrmH family RNA methyltransferase [Rhodospirillum centenum]|uniref:RNA methyltransferase, TrmH family, putative n=1 Tax=Rhodospirillum centenum (strain ATCC 51521 / SW) TaxID=414684 RepID=B6IUD3_RHOCS|nr:TrmH family RNA methyltransferase [Rhodospirillum centenum]ACJ00113.1 RNA methyltransferase, TrmH family, putative [Rhodospirillum centenum SW]
MRGYFALGAEGISKSGNVGTILRTGHAFGASFVFTVNAALDMAEVRRTDTSGGDEHVPLYAWNRVADMALPEGCQLVGVELTDDAVVLPSFRHPLRAAYVLGPERGSLSPAMVARCDHIVRIPTKFCVNVSVAAAVVMYDRMISLGRFAERPVRAGGPTDGPPVHVHGAQKIRNPASKRMRPLLGGWD